MRHVTLMPGITIPAPTPITKGLEILRIFDGKSRPYSFGTMEETVGKIHSIEIMSFDGPPKEAVVLEWPDGYVEEASPDQVVAYADFLAWREINGTTVLTPKYRVDQVLFIKPDRNIRSSPEWPAINSPAETDVKVTEVLMSQFGSVISYKVYIPRTGYRTIPENQLVSVAERDRMLHNDFKEHFFTEDRLPFFRRGERVKSYDGFLYNIKETVIVQLNDELRKCLSWSIKPE